MSIKILAATRLLADKNWSEKVKTKHHTPEGLFTKSAEAIATELKKEHGDLKGAMSALNFYYNRAGSNLSDEDKSKWDSAKEKLRSQFASPIPSHAGAIRLSDPSMNTTMAATVKRLSKDPNAALRFLQDIGIATPTGRLSKKYGG